MSQLTQKAQKMMSWAFASGLRFYIARGACCADEWSQVMACRYDLERFGARLESDPRSCDLLVVSGAFNQKSAEALKAVYRQMAEPRYVLAVGTCACTGGVFSPQRGGVALAGIESVLPVDVFVPGCPPRPEAILDGWMAIQKKIQVSSIGKTEGGHDCSF